MTLDHFHSLCSQKRLNDQFRLCEASRGAREPILPKLIEDQLFQDAFDDERRILIRHLSFAGIVSIYDGSKKTPIFVDTLRKLREKIKHRSDRGSLADSVKTSNPAHYCVQLRAAVQKRFVEMKKEFYQGISSLPFLQLTNNAWFSAYDAFHNHKGIREGLKTEFVNALSSMIDETAKMFGEPSALENQVDERVLVNEILGLQKKSISGAWSTNMVTPLRFAHHLFSQDTKVS